MTTADNKAIVRRFYAAFEANDLNALRDLLAEDLVAHNPNPQNKNDHLQGISMWAETFSEIHFEIIEQIGEGELVASHVKMRSIHSKANFQDVPPSGKQIVIPAISLERVRDGKIVERAVYSDRLGMMRQLGLLPSS